MPGSGESFGIHTRFYVVSTVVMLPEWVFWTWNTSGYDWSSAGHVFL